MDEQLLAALSLPFEEYMQWCWSFVQRKAESSVHTRIVLSYPFVDVSLEASWARRYWVHHASKQGTKV